MQTVADIMIEILKEFGVNTVFGIPSIHNLAFYDALRRDPSVRHILCRHETTATHMADGYAREGGRPGVVITSTGPGAGYSVPALQEALGSSSPVLAITTNIPTGKIGKGVGSLHELEAQHEIFRNITKVVFPVRVEEDVAPMTRDALEALLQGRPGPVYLEVPTDLLRSPLETGKLPVTGKDHQGSALPDLEEAISLIRSAKSPLIAVGTAAVRAGISGLVADLAETIGAPVIFTPNARGLVPDDHPLALGNATRRGVIREAISSSDLAVAIGTRLREMDAKRRGMTLPRLIHVDWDNDWVGKNFPTEISLTGDLREIVDALLKGLKPAQDMEQRIQRVREFTLRREDEEVKIRRCHPEMAYLQELRDALPRESTVVVDNTQLGYWAEYFYPCHVPGGLMFAKGASIIGFAFAAAAGAKLASPEKPVVALIGDGGFLYSTQELATCMRHRIGFPVLVVNSRSFSVIAYLQRTFHKKEYESSLVNPDFVTLAAAYGVEGCRVESPAGLREALGEALSSGEMRVIELVEEFPEPPFGKY